MSAVTGVGSVPFTEMEPALDFVFETCPQWPHLPELGGGMVDRGLGESLSLDVEGLPVDFLLRLSQSRALGVKLQLCGPLTLSQCAPEHPMEALVERVYRTARLWQSQVAGPGLLLLDEPMLEQDSGPLKDLIQALKSTEWRVGVHTCGPPPMAVLRALEMDLLSFDSHRYKKDFEQGGGFEGGVLWGAVSTDGLHTGSVGAGWVTPACGLALRTPAQARSVMARVAALATLQSPGPT
ncbi:MAG: hypothetical protein ACI9VR_003666 [Cognaticolwellia sp.]|jgi:hypothetical protein